MMDGKLCQLTTAQFKAKLRSNVQHVAQNENYRFAQPSNTNLFLLNETKNRIYEIAANTLVSK